MHNQVTMTINGEGRAAQAMLAVCNPATGAVFAHAPDADAADLDAAANAAARAFPTWRGTPIAQRKAALFAAADAIEAHADELTALFVQEQGRPVIRPKTAAW